MIPLNHVMPRFDGIGGASNTELIERQRIIFFNFCYPAIGHVDN